MSERTPLLGNALLDEANAPAVNNDEEPRYGPELSLLARASVPISFSFALQNIVQAISIFVVGGLGTFELGVASYGYMFASSTGSVVAMGGATALDTLCSQAITSAKPEEKATVLMNYLQRGLVILTTFFIVVIAPLWWVSGDLFVLLGQEENFAQETGRFLRILIPGGVLQIWAECLKKLLQVQGHSFAVSWAIAIAALIGIAANFLLVRVANLGVIGAPLAHIVYHLSTTICLVIYMIIKSDSNTKMRGLNRGKLADWTRFSNMAITGILTLAAEGFSFEILAMMAARLDPVSIGAQGIIMTTDIILYTIPMGLGVAASHRIGNLLGAGHARGARFATRMPYILALILGILEFVLIMSAQNWFGYIFSNEEAVVRLTAQVLPLMACFQILDLGNGGACGILRGAGKVHLAGASNIVAYYGLSMTTAWYFCFTKELGIFGLWTGMITGSAVLLVLQTLWVALINWEKEARFISEQDYGTGSK